MLENYKQLNQLIVDTYNEENQKIIGCPTTQQVSYINLSLGVGGFRLVLSHLPVVKQSTFQACCQKNCQLYIQAPDVSNKSPPSFVQKIAFARNFCNSKRIWKFAKLLSALCFLLLYCLACVTTFWKTCTFMVIGRCIVIQYNSNSQ